MEIWYPLNQNKEVRAALEAAHLPAKDFAGHSFRIRTATTAASAGLPDSAMQALGHWKGPLIATYFLYIRMEPNKLAKVPSV